LVPVTPPALVAAYSTASWDIASTQSLSVTVAAGETLAIAAGSTWTGSAFTPSGGTGITYTPQVTLTGATATPSITWWTAGVPSSQSYSIALTTANSSHTFGFLVMRFAGATGVGATASNHDTSNQAPTLAVTSLQPSSVLAVCVIDYNATSGTSRAWRTGPGTITEEVYVQNGSDITAYAGFYPNVTPAGGQTVGLTAPTLANYSIAAIELQGISANVAPIVMPRLASMQASTW
jgi:hypothetical protein